MGRSGGGAETYGLRFQQLTGDGQVEWQTGEVLGTAATYGCTGHLSGRDTVLVDAGSGFCWTWGDTGDFIELGGNGQEEKRYSAFASSWDNAGLNTADRSLYFVSGAQAALLRVAQDGTQQQVALGFTPNPQGCGAEEVAVNPSDGSLWVDISTIAVPGNAQGEDAFLHLSAEGQQLGSILIPSNSYSYDAGMDKSDGSLWAGVWAPHGSDGLTHYGADGTQLWQDPSPLFYANGVAVDESDGSCWVCYLSQDEVATGAIRHFAKDGTSSCRFPEGAYEVAVDQATGFCWAAEASHVSVWDKAGDCMWKGKGFAVNGNWSGGARTIGVDVRDGSVWVYNYDQGQLVHLWVPVTVFSDVLYDRGPRSISACVIGPGSWEGIRMGAISREGW